MTSDLEIRDATAADAPDILAIYNEVIGNSNAVWRETPVALAEREDWMAGRAHAGFPVLVATELGAVVGFGSFGPWRSAPGYLHTVEHSVHVRAGLRGRGVGRALLAALIGRAQAMGLHVMVGGIEAGNAASLALHERLGFQRAALHREVGRKFGQWLDLVFVERRL